MLVPVFVLLSILAGVRAGGTRVAPDGGRALPDEAPVDIFILAGQSNMDVAPNAAATPLPRNDRVLEFTWANELVIADQVTSVRVPPKNRLWRTPAVEFANAYADAHPTRRVLLVPCAVGATGFTPTTWPDMVTHWNLYVRRYGGNVTSEPIAAASDAVWLANGVLFRSTVRRAEAAPGPSTLQTSPAPSSMLDATAVWSATATLTSEVVERNASSAPAVPTLGGVPPPCSCPWPAAAAVAMSAAASALVAAVVSAAATTCWHRRALSGRSLVLALPRARTTPAKATPSTHDDEETMPLHAVPPKPGDAAQDSVT